MWIVLLIAVLLILASLDFYYGHKKQVSLELPPSYGKGEMQFLSTGYHFFDALFEDIKNAVEYIHIQFYILRDDELGQELCSLLIQKAQKGVEVRLLVDCLGSHGIKNETIQSLKQAGIHFQKSNKPGFPYFLYRLNHRNHRKVVIIDGNIGYIGGYNIGNEYIGKDTKLGDWRDYHLRLKGSVVDALQQSFNHDWNVASGDKVSVSATIDHDDPSYKDFMLVHSSGSAVYRFFYEKIQRSKKSILIGSAYFIPGKKMNKALLRAIKRGVKLTLVVPMNPDHPFVQEASYIYLKPLLEAGAEIYQFHEGFYHSKVLMFDEQICDIGTANFDFRSFFFNDEINCIFTDKHYIQEVKRVIESDLARSEILTLERLKKTRTPNVRIKEAVSFILSPFL
ncbi:cardiolipin synthase [Fictibacillus phosphorivorans]|uniref:cardiolipin synthase n=1 Tax=Fictibacillus phosphorivorans TaxID=1221500 RepID=UPI00203A9B4E|nr:cardiolipin synthase [Fictibacillus phosphorivorans]MCM3718438.1 cardiolipin synthase [Fictibacillus phosphorivorans]MCM3776062.1 cardiolipin synthase [Fictibacillus phosphorivorans]